LYTRLAASGYQYGPAFQALRAAWSGRDGIYADVALDPDLTPDPGSFLLHPALFDAALHAAIAPMLDERGGVFVPYVLRGVRLHAPGAQAMRVHLTGADVLSLSAVDDTGLPVVSIGSLSIREVDAARMTGAGQGSQLLRLEWKQFPSSAAAGQPDPSLGFLGADSIGLTDELESAQRQVVTYRSLRSLDAALRNGEPVPDVVMVCCAGQGGGAQAARSAAGRALVLAQEWLADERLAGSRLVFLTRGAVAVKSGEAVADLENSVVWGLVRSAQSEHPGRFGLVDIDEAAGCAASLMASIATAEPQVAVRRGRLLRPRLRRCPSSAPQGNAGSWAKNGTIMITGGTGALGGMVARHLVRRHGVRRLLLVSRRGADAPGAGELAGELTAAGADVAVASADVAEREDMLRVLDTIPPEHPLTAVLHCAGVLADATVASLTPAKLDQVMRPKVDAAVNLDQLTRAFPDCELVLFSSVSGLLGSAGQANYAAANCFLDAVAHRRKAAGLRGMTLAWGLWTGSDGMAEDLAAADLSRLARSGIVPLAAEDGLALLDACRARNEAVLVPVRLDEVAMRAPTVVLPGIMADLGAQPADLREPARAASEGEAGLLDTLARLADSERERAMVEFICAQGAAVLGHVDASEVAPDGDFADIGFDSLTNLELSRRLAAAIGMRLPATISFDYPSPVKLAAYLLGLL
jgi:nucleoside-diphosphate-sugar epimerase